MKRQFRNLAPLEKPKPFVIKRDNRNEIGSAIWIGAFIIFFAIVIFLNLPK